ncbi:hypothetical protein BsWGS_24232 [Bradybaena similaris]
MEVPAESPSEITGKLIEMRLSPPISVSADLKTQAGDLIMRNDENEIGGDNGNIHSHIPETGSNVKNLAEPNLQYKHITTASRKLQKRQAWSWDNAFYILRRIMLELFEEMEREAKIEIISDGCWRREKGLKTLLLGGQALPIEATKILFHFFNRPLTFQNLNDFNKHFPSLKNLLCNDTLINL